MLNIRLSNQLDGICLKEHQTVMDNHQDPIQTAALMLYYTSPDIEDGVLLKSN